MKITAATAPRIAAWRQVGGASVFWAGLRRERARAFASSRLWGRPARRLVSIRPPWVPRCLRRRFFLVWAIWDLNLPRPGRRGDPRIVCRAGSRSRIGTSSGYSDRAAAGTNPISSPSRGRAPSGAASSRTIATTRASGTASGSWTLVETWVRPEESSRPIALTPAGPPPDSRRPAATAFATSTSELSSSTLNAASGGRAVTRVAPAVRCGSSGPASGRSSPLSIRSQSSGRPPLRK